MTKIPEFDTIFCIVSEQALPNITPLYDFQIGQQCKNVILFATDKMKLRAEWLKNALLECGTHVEIVALTESDDFSDMSKQFAAELQRYPNAALNATGGKKTMSLAAHGVFVRMARPVFYVERDNTLQWLAADRAFPVTRLTGSLSLASLLGVYGWQVTSRQVEMDKLQLGFAAEMYSKQNFAPAIVDLQFNGKDEIKSIRSKTSNALSSSQQDVLAIANKYGLVKKASGQWQCNGAQAKFISGEWLELHIQSLVAQLEVPDVCRGLKIAAIAGASVDGKAVENEADVAFVHHNQLFLIECKALKKTKPLADFLYTLESIKKSGGLTTKAALLTWGCEAGPGDVQRAEKENIRMFSGDALASINLGLGIWCGRA